MGAFAAASLTIMGADIFEKTLTTGAGGMIGRYIDFGIRTDHATLDITDLSMVRAVCREHMPKIIIHLAAATDLVRCEQDPAYAHLVNAVGTYHMALVAREIDAKLVYVSTSGIFDGTKETPYTAEDVPNPPNHYGHSKYLGELAVRGLIDDHLIVRVAWVFGGGPSHDKKFVAKVLQQLDKSEISVVTDKRGSPTYGKDAVDAIKQLIKEGKRGTYHRSNAGVASRFDIASEIVAITGSSAKVIGIDSGSFPFAYATGPNESMVAESPCMRPWQDALRDYIGSEWNVVEQ